MRKHIFFLLAATAAVSLPGTQSAFGQNGSPYWSLAGNSNSTLSNVLGTTSNVSLRIVTNNTDRIKILSTGNVGIGTSSPNEKLHVIGKGLFSAGLTVSGGGLTATHTSGTGVRATGSSSGVNANATGSTATGVIGTSPYIGVYGNGNSFGTYGYATATTSYGVYGFSTGSSGFGVYGNGTRGVFGNTGTVGGTAVYGQATASNAYGVHGYSSASYGVYGTTASASSYAGYFNGNVFSTGSYLASDRSLKQDVTDMGSGLDVIKKLQPKTYSYRQDGAYKLMNLPEGRHYGLIAQDLEQVLPGLVKATSFESAKAAPIAQEPGTSATAAPPTETILFKAVNYTELMAVVVKGMQEQQQQIEEQQVQLEELKKLAATFTKGQGRIASGNGFHLSQNTPNPARAITRISCNLPVGYKGAQLVLFDNSGRRVKTIPVPASGAVEINTDFLSSGVYPYSLVVDGNIIATKKLTVAR